MGSRAIALASHYSYLKENTMNKKVISATIQLKQNNRKIFRGVEQNDTGVILDIRVMDGLRPFDFSGYSLVTLKVTKPDGTIYVDSDASSLVDTIDSVNGRFKVGIPATLTAQKGMHFCQVGFGGDSATYFQSIGFNYFVSEDPMVSDDEVMGTNELPILQNLIIQFSHMADTLQRFEEEEHDRQTNEAAREAEFLALKQQIADALLAAQQAKGLYDWLLQAIHDAGVVLPIPVDPSDLVTEDELSEALYGYVTADDLASELDDLHLPQVVAQTTAPTDTTKIWIDTSGANAVVKYYANNAWKSANVAVFA